MFEPRTPLYLRDVTFKIEEGKEETRKVVVCSFMVQPFTPAMAEKLGIRSRLFNASTGEPDPVVKSLEAAIAVPDQRIEFAMAPDAGREAVSLPNCRISKTIRIARDKEGPVFRATFTASSPYPAAKDLLFLAHHINDQHYITFTADGQGDLIDSTADGEGDGAGEGEGADA